MTSSAADRHEPTGTAAYPDPVRPPWEGFALAASAAVAHLNGALGLDLWMVTHVEGDRQVVVASAGRWAEQARAGAEFAWQASFCRPMVERRAPTAAADLRAVPAYAEVAVGPLARVKAYLGVPLVGDDGELFGTLCAFAGRPVPELPDRLGLVELVAQMLSTVLAGQQVALARSQEAAAAYALADRDRLTGLRNRRGWEAAVAQEHSRCQRYGSAASVLVLEVVRPTVPDDAVGRRPDAADGQDAPDAADRLVVRAAEVLRATVRPGDAVARVGDRELALLAVSCDTLSLRALLARLRVELRSAGVPAVHGTACRRSGESLEQTWARAEQQLARDRRVRAARHEPVVPVA